MTATRTEARDEILTQFKTIWDIGPESTGVLVLYPDKPSEPPKGQNTPWARITVLHNGSGGQATLSGETGNRRFRRFGVVIIQVFTIFGEGMVLNDRLSEIAQAAFEGVTTPLGVIFRGVNAIEIGKSGEWIQTNVTAQFEYDEIK